MMYFFVKLINVIFSNSDFLTAVLKNPGFGLLFSLINANAGVKFLSKNVLLRWVLFSRYK